MKTFQIDTGKKVVEVVTGLTWHPLLPDNFRKAMRPLANEVGADLYVYWRSSRSIIGFAHKVDETGKGAKEGQIPAALIIAKALEAENAPPNTMVAVECPGDPNCFIYVVRNDGSILSDLDVTGTREEIRTRLQQDYAFGGWEMVVCPADWEINGSTERSFDSFLPFDKGRINIPSSWALRPVKVSITKFLFPVLIGTTLILGGLYGYKQWENHKAALLAQQQEELAAQQAHQEQQKALEREPWTETIKARDYVDACDELVMSKTYSVPNWRLVEYGCEGNAFHIKWERSTQGGLVSTLKDLRPDAMVDIGGATASQVIPIQLGPVVKGAPEGTPFTRNQAIEHFADFSRKFGIDVRFKEQSAQPQLPPGQPNQTVQSKWQKLELVASTNLSLQSSMQLIDAPTLRISSITGVLKDGNLKYEISGVLYVSQ